MGIIHRAIQQAIETRESLANPSKWLVMAFGGGQQTATGIQVNEAVGLRSTTVMACVRIIAETMAQLPLPVYQRIPGGKQQAADHPLWPVLHDQTNSEMTAFDFRETLTAHLLTWGNAYAEIERDNAGRIISLWPMLPDRTWPQRLSDGRIWYATRLKKDPMSIGIDDTRTIWLPSDRVLHIKGLGFDGLKGYSVIQYARELVAQDLALNEFAGRFFGNGAVPGGVLMTDRKLNKEQHDRLRISWQEQHQGLTNAQRVAILEEGLQWKEIGIPLKDAQWIEARKYTRNELISLFRIPPHMVGDVERTTSWGSGIEQQAIGFLVYTITPWAVRWEKAILSKLFGPTERQSFFAEFLMDGLVRGDIQTRTAAYTAGWGKWLHTDEIREMENRNPLTEEQKKDMLVPLNMAPLAVIEGTSAPEPKLPMQAPTEDVEPSAASSPLPHLELRRAMIQSQRHALSEAYERSLRRERVDVSKGLERRSGEEGAVWVRAFYAEHREFLGRAILPPLMGLADATVALIASEFGRDLRPSSEFWRFVRDYCEGAAERYCSAALSDLAKGVSLDERSVDRIVRAELSRSANAFALALYRDQNEPRKRWCSVDVDEGCAELNGMVIAMEERFNGTILHPPLHEGCTCLILADRVPSERSDANGHEPSAEHRLVEFLSRYIEGIRVAKAVASSSALGHLSE